MSSRTPRAPETEALIGLGKKDRTERRLSGSVVQLVYIAGGVPTKGHSAADAFGPNGKPVGGKWVDIIYLRVRYPPLGILLTFYRWMASRPFEAGKSICIMISPLPRRGIILVTFLIIVVLVLLRTARWNIHGGVLRPRGQCHGPHNQGVSHACLLKRIWVIHDCDRLRRKSDFWCYSNVVKVFEGYHDINISNG